MNHEDPERGGPSKRQERRLQEVWSFNLEEEVKRMAEVAEVYQHIALDTQFPGIVARPTGPFNDFVEYNYQTLKCNVDLTKVLQIGMTFSDGKGNRPKGISTWRFNFGFDAHQDMYAQETLDSLHQTRSLDLPKHQSQGVQPHLFAELLMTSGIVLNEDIRWITYRGTGGFSQRVPEACPGRPPADPPWIIFCGMYDLGHLLQMLSGQTLPDEAHNFCETLDLFFPSRCDIAKHLNRLPQLSGSFFQNAHHLLEAFFRLPDPVKRTAFDRASGEEDGEESTLAQAVAVPASNVNTTNRSQRKQQSDRRR